MHPSLHYSLFDVYALSVPRCGGWGFESTHSSPRPNPQGFGESRFSVDKFVQWLEKMKPHNTLAHVGIDQCSCSCLWHAGMLLEQASVGSRQSDSYSNNPVEAEVWGNPDCWYICTCCLFRRPHYSAKLLGKLLSLCRTTPQRQLCLWGTWMVTTDSPRRGGSVMQHSKLLWSGMTWPDNILSGFQKNGDHNVESDDSIEVDLSVCLPPKLAELFNSDMEEDEIKEF